jgi:hypothetical protein
MRHGIGQRERFVKRLGHLCATRFYGSLECLSENRDWLRVCEVLSRFSDTWFDVPYLHLPRSAWRTLTQLPVVAAFV